MASNTFSITLYYKQTGMPVPVKTLTGWIEMKHKIQQKNAMDEVEKMISTLDLLEDEMCEYNTRSNKLGKAVKLEKYYEKCWGEDWQDKLLTWIYFIVRLIHIGRLEQNDNYGWEITMAHKDSKTLYIERNGREEETLLPLIRRYGEAAFSNFESGIAEEVSRSQNLCAVCQTPSKQKCPYCITRYCCKEHQVADWKAGHKKSCEKKRKDYAEMCEKVRTAREAEGR
jgi:hypothetical protein